MNIQIRKDKLLEILKINKDIHIGEYREARKAYIEATVVELSEAIEKLKENKDVNTFHLFKNPKSKNYATSYDTAIKMLNWHDQDTVELDAKHYNAYVEDEWDWTNEFKNTSSSYGNPKGL